MKCLVLDKSYLRGATAAEVQNLTDRYVVLMIETLFYELATSPDDEFRGLLSKISRPNAVRLLPRPGVLFQHEIANQTPATPVVDYALPGSIQLNPGFELTPAQEETLRDWRQQVDAEIEGYPAMARGIEKWPIGLAGTSEVERRAKCEELKATMSPSDVRSVYQDIAGDVFPQFPASPLIDERWALFRWTQSQIVGALDFVAAYGFLPSVPNRERLENHIHDLDYLTIAGQVGALATRDRQLADNLRSIRSDATIVE